MSTLVNRMKSGLRRMGDWITGHDVDVVAEAPAVSPLNSQSTARPLIDVFESDDELMVVADVPGAHPESTHVHVDGDRLTVLAKVPSLADAHLLVGGASAVDWYAEFAIPERIDSDRVYASLRQGVLTVHLALRARDKPHRVPVTSAG